MLIDKMVESSVIISTGPVNVNNKPTDLIILNNNNNNNNESDNEKHLDQVQVTTNGHSIKDDDNQNEDDEIIKKQNIQNNQIITKEDVVSSSELKISDDDKEEDEEYQDVQEENGEEEFESLDEGDDDDDDENGTSSEEDEGQFELEQETETTRRRGVIPDVLLNELHEILVFSRKSKGEKREVQVGTGNEEDDENEESWNCTSSSSSSSSPSPSPVLVLSTIPEEDEAGGEDDDWDSDSTLTELSGAGHARHPPLSDVSTQKPPPLQQDQVEIQPSSVLPAVGPTAEVQSIDSDSNEKGPHQEKGPLIISSNNNNNNSISVSPPILKEEIKESYLLSPIVPTFISSPTHLLVESGSHGCPSKKSVTFSCDDDKHDSDTTADELEEDEKVVEVVEKDSQSLSNNKIINNKKEKSLYNSTKEEEEETQSKSLTPSDQFKLLEQEKSLSPQTPQKEKVELVKDNNNESTTTNKLITRTKTSLLSPLRNRKLRVTFKDFSPSGENNKTKRVVVNNVEVEEGEQAVLTAVTNSSPSTAPSSSSGQPTSEYFVVKLLAAEQQRQLDLVDLSRLTTVSGTYDSDGGRELSKFIEASTVGSYFSDNNNSDPTININPIISGEMHQRLSSSCSEHQHLPPGVPREKPRSVLRKQGASVKGRSGRNVSFNESLNLFYEAECQCWIHEDDYARLRHEEHMQQQLIYEQATQLHQLHHHHHHHHTPYLAYEPPPLEFEDTPTLSPPEGYKDRFFPHMEHHLQQLQLQQQLQHQQQQQQQQQSSQDPDVTRVSPPSPPAARRKVFLKENSTEQQPMVNHNQRPILNGLEEDEDEESRAKKQSSRFGGILKGGRLWRTNSSKNKKISPSSDEPDLVKCTENKMINTDTPFDDDHDDDNINYPIQHQINQSQQVEMDAEIMVGPGQQHRPTQVSIGTAPLRTSEQIRLAVDSTLRISRSKKNKQECSSLVEKLRWLTSLDDEDSDSQSGFATWPSRDKNGLLLNNSTPSSTSSSSRKSDAGTSTSEEFVHPNLAMRNPISSNEAKIKQISYTLEDIDEGLKGGENELETFITEDGGRIERIRRRYVGVDGGDVGGDDYGFSRRPSVKGIKPKFSSTNQIFAQFTRAGAETPIPQMQLQMESQYENTRSSSSSNNSTNLHYESLPGGGGSGDGGGARVNLNYDQFPPNPTPTSVSGGSSSANNGNNGNVTNNSTTSTSSQPQPTVRPGVSSSEESRSNFELIRQSFEQASHVNRPHSWSASNTLPHNHTHQNQVGPTLTSTGHIPLPGMTNNVSINSGNGQQQQNNLSSSMGMNGVGVVGARPNSMPGGGLPLQQQQQQQMMYGTLPSSSSQQNHVMMMMGQQQQQGPGGQQMYGTVRRVPNVISRPLFLVDYDGYHRVGRVSVEAHPNKLVQPYPPTKVPETPSPTQPQQPPQQAPVPINNIKYYGPPIRYYPNPPPPVPPRSATTTIGSSNNGGGGGGPPAELERGNPEGDEGPGPVKEYSMNV